jgi:U3 small nucleolar RNA-associated protein 12
MQLFLEEERERELEAIYDANAERDRERNELRATREGGAIGPEVSAVEKTTTETLMAGEKIMEALDISEEDRTGADAYEESKTSMTDESIAKMAPRQRNPIFSIYPSYIDPEVHVLKVVQKIPPASLNDALLVLPFSKVVSMLKHLDFWAQHVRDAGLQCRGLSADISVLLLPNAQRLHIALTSRVLFFLLKIHYSQIVATRLMRSTILQLKAHLQGALEGQKVGGGLRSVTTKEAEFDSSGPCVGNHRLQLGRSQARSSAICCRPDKRVLRG